MLCQDEDGPATGAALKRERAGGARAALVGEPHVEKEEEREGSAGRERGATGRMVLFLEAEPRRRSDEEPEEEVMEPVLNDGGCGSTRLLGGTGGTVGSGS